MRIWLKRGLKLSLVVAATAAAYDAWLSNAYWSETQVRKVRLDILYNCMVRHYDAGTLPTPSVFGTYSAQDAGCSSEPSWVSLQELTQMKAGTLFLDWSPDRFYPERHFATGLVYGLMTILSIVVILGILRTLSWIWRA